MGDFVPMSFIEMGKLSGKCISYNLSTQTNRYYIGT